MDDLHPFTLIFEDDVMRAFALLHDIANPPIDPINPDHHNVHDNTVVQTFRASFQKIRDQLEQAKEAKCSDKMADEMLVNRLFHPDCPHPYAIRLKAIQTYQTIQHSNEFIVCLDLRETQIFSTLLNYIHVFKKEKEVEEIIDSLIERLADAIEDEMEVVCAMGRMLRLLDTLNTIDPNVSIIPTNLMRKEMQYRCYQLFQNLSDDLEGDITDPRPDVIEVPDSEEENADAIAFRVRFEEQVRYILQKEYIDTGLASSHFVEEELATWLRDIQ